MMLNLLKNYKTKILFALILCLFVSLGAPISAEAEFAGVEETPCGDLTYSISADGHLKITGTGGYSRKYFNGNTYLGPYPFWYEYKRLYKDSGSEWCVRDHKHATYVFWTYRTGKHCF